MVVPGNNTEHISVPPAQRFDHRASELEVRGQRYAGLAPLVHFAGRLSARR
jgi:hypothetical protein